MATELDPHEIRQFHETLFSWWIGDNRRELPWRETDNPYYIMISEFMLQQTQVSRVIPKFHEFTSKYPTIQDLAVAEKSDVIKLWQGLGYNRRAIWLQEAAVQISKMDEFPRDRKELEKIKGIGPYSSRSISIFAFNANYGAVDTNIRRILIHYGFINEDDKPNKIQKIADLLVPKGRSRDYHNAMMDYGATHLTASRTGIQSKSQQSSFENSDRQIRGKINSILIENGKITKSELLGKLKDGSELDSKKRFNEILSKLENDGMIQIDDNLCALPR